MGPAKHGQMWPAALKEQQVWLVWVGFLPGRNGRVGCCRAVPGDGGRVPGSGKGPGDKYMAGEGPPGQEAAGTLIRAGL